MAKRNNDVNIKLNNEMKKRLFSCMGSMPFRIIISGLFILSCSANLLNEQDEKDKDQRIFIAHRGVNLGCTIAGENSLEAIRLAKRAGFETLETDVRLTADSVLVVMHDATLNRTCLYRNGAELTEKENIADKTLAEVKSAYRLKATEPDKRTTIPTFKEYLAECKRCEIKPFIEPKLYDEKGQHYRNIIKEADEVMGKNNYIITSNNRANIIIRKMGLKDVPLMGILYQTTFDEIKNLGNIIMAISTSQFTEKDYSFFVNEAKSCNLETESHADNFDRFTMINDNDIDYISTDYLAPDLKTNSTLVADRNNVKDLEYNGKLVDGTISLEANNSITLKNKLPQVYFGAIYLEMDVKGSCEVQLSSQKFSIQSGEAKKYRHQIMIYNSVPEFRITATDRCDIKNIHLRLAKF
jgi:glycerophosphoryl diester phosphodiesterase